MQYGAVRDGRTRLEGTRGNRWRHRVSGVVEAVCKVERQGGPDDQNEDKGVVHGLVLTEREGRVTTNFAISTQNSRRFHS